jgi:hypothetical protein
MILSTGYWIIVVAAVALMITLSRIVSKGTRGIIACIVILGFYIIIMFALARYFGISGRNIIGANIIGCITGFLVIVIYSWLI